MKVLSLIVQRIAVDVVDDLASHGARDLSVLPLASIPLAAVAQSQVSLLLARAVPVALFDRGVRWNGNRRVSNGTNHSVAAAVMLAVGQPAVLLLVGVERIAVPVPHLIVTPAHLPGDRWALAVKAGATDDLSTPAIIWRAMPFHSLVVHQTKAVGGMLSFASGDGALLHAANDNSFPRVYLDKALGNSMAVPVMRWIGRRIAMVEAIAAESLAA